MSNQYTMHYGNFIGMDASSDPRAVARNRLAYCVNMWRDYESEQGAAIETFPGFRRVAQSLGLDGNDGEIGAVHGLYHFRTRRGVDLVVVHAGARLYAFEIEALAAGDYEEIGKRSAILSEGVADRDSTGFIFNNNLYILDGEHYLRVSDVGEENASIEASAVDAYIPTTYFNGNMYEQRNMLSTRAYQLESEVTENIEEKGLIWNDIFKDYPHVGTEHTIGFREGYSSPKFYAYEGVHDYDGNLSYRKDNIRVVYVTLSGTGTGNETTIGENAFNGCQNLEKVYIKDTRKDSNGYYINTKIGEGAFANCPKLTDVYYNRAESRLIYENGTFPKGVNFHFYDYVDSNMPEDMDRNSCEYEIKIPIYEFSEDVAAVSINGEDTVNYAVKYDKREIDGEEKEYVEAVFVRSSEVVDEREVKIELELYPAHIQTAEGYNSFIDGNPDYRKTTIEALNGCTKAAVYDGRVFLTGNGELPNTVFYSHRNLTGANDPAYFGIYNYFNDGVGNTPNVDLLSTPSYLMVIKSDTVQDGSVFYHVGMENTDEFSRDLLPRIYPSTQGAAGLGSAGKPTPSRLSCNFLDDAVFLSKRGLEGVGKETVNLERTIQHRSSNIDRLLIKEDLSKATMAEWKGYLVICCAGKMYLADSRYFIQHPDGSYQYEWYYLEGLGTYKSYEPIWRFIVDEYPVIDLGGADAETLDRFVTKEGKTVKEFCRLKKSEGKIDDLSSIITVPVYHPEDTSIIVDLYYVIEDGVNYLVGITDGEKRGVGEIQRAEKVLSVGDRLLFGTPSGDVCIINTDMRGKSVDGREVYYNQLDRSFYSFNGVAYRSGCSFRLDDCDKKSVAKCTECGTTAVRFKTMPGSRAWINITLNGRDWYNVESFNSRFDFADMEFSNLSFTENEDNVLIVPELTRNWVNKQYYIYNDVFEDPFGLYELSYVYYVYGKIRY
jgi:hypothetical protein